MKTLVKGVVRYRCDYCKKLIPIGGSYVLGGNDAQGHFCNQTHKKRRIMELYQLSFRITESRNGTSN